MAATAPDATTGTVDIQAGIVEGLGTINAHLVNAGQVSPGGTNATGVLTVTGSYTQSGTGILNIETGGAPAGNQYDRLSISGIATLGGTLNVSLINNFVLTIDQNFPVLLFGSRSGNSDFVNGLDLGSDLILERSFGTTSLTLVTKRKP